MGVTNVSDLTMRDSDFIQRGGLWVATQNALTVAALLLAPLFRGQWEHPLIVALGIGLFSFGGWVGLAGVRALGRNRTPFPQPLADSALVQHGIYARVRHPLYSSLIFTSFGWALGWGSWVGLAAAGSLTLLLHCKARNEERWLRLRYPSYDAYAQCVSRFLPWP